MFNKCVKKFAAQIVSTRSHVPSQPLWTAIKGEYLVMFFFHFRYYRPFVYIRQSLFRNSFNNCT